MQIQHAQLCWLVDNKVHQLFRLGLQSMSQEQPEEVAAYLNRKLGSCNYSRD